MKIATKIEKKDKGYIVWVNDGGLCAMCELKDGEWETCYFPTYEDAEKAKNDYNEVWSSKERS